MRDQRGFTLMELAVLLAILALAACLITPTLAQVRGPDGQKQRSTANLKLHGQVLALYANTHRGEVLNPFDEHRPRSIVSPPWSGGAYSMRSDAYSYHWGELIRQYYEDYERVDVFAAPGDEETINKFIDDPDSLYDISYWYSQTMYYDWHRFRDADGGASDDVDFNLVRRNEISDLRFPSRKVIVLEKQDFATPEKLLFSHPDARVGMLLGDGSVTESDNLTLYDAIAADPSLTPSGGNWADEGGLAQYGMGNSSSPDELLEDQQHLYPAFYLWTREGIKGRDLF
ncbi:MAG: prepilin-type N-terminal cleavage/methylation domain-containing protein [Phycisphaerales bacterium JB038]